MGVSFVLWAAGITRPCRFPISRRRGRCLHRPAGNGRFMAVFRRIRVDFPFSTVGADDPVRPPETPVFTENRCEFATFLEGRCGHRPLQITTKNQRISRADRVVRPYKRDTIDRLYHRIPYIKYRPCRDISGARNRPILQTSGVFVKFIFHAVGVDAYIDPQETAVLWRFSGESVLISHFPP